MSKRLRLILEETWLPAGLVVAWWFLSDNGTSFYFPPLHRIAGALRDDWLFSHVGSDLLPSLGRLFGGLGLAITAGIALGIALGRSRRLLAALNPALHFMRALPTVALVPAAVIVLGIGDGEKIAIIAFASLWPVLLSTIDGIRGVEPLLIDIGRSFRIPRWRRLLHIELPAASPAIVAGVRVSLAVGVIMLIFSEMYAAFDGIGFYVVQAQRQFHITQTWAGSIVLGVVGYLLNVGFRVAEHRILSWHPSHRRTPVDG